MVSARRLTLTVDGRDHSFVADPDMPLLYALRNELAKRGPRFGCGLAQCGACTVLVDGQPMRSCVLPVSAVSGQVRTLDGLADGESPHPVQAAFMSTKGKDRFASNHAYFRLPCTAFHLHTKCQ